MVDLKGQSEQKKNAANLQFGFILCVVDSETKAACTSSWLVQSELRSDSFHFCGVLLNPAKQLEKPQKKYSSGIFCYLYAQFNEQTKWVKRTEFTKEKHIQVAQ